MYNNYLQNPALKNIYWVGEKSLGTITLQCISLINGTV